MLWFLGLALTPCAFSRSSAEKSFHGITPLLSPALTSFHKSMCTPSLLPSGFPISPSVLAPLIHLFTPFHVYYPLHIPLPGQDTRWWRCLVSQCREMIWLKNSLSPNFICLFLTHFSSLIPIASGEYPSRNTCGAQGLSPLHGVNAMLMY